MSPTQPVWTIDVEGQTLRIYRYDERRDIPAAVAYVAPELLAALRDVEDHPNHAYGCHRGNAPCARCRARALLARVDGGGK